MRTLAVGIVGLVALAVPALSLAAGIDLFNGGMGQAAGNAQAFGVAICNGSAITLDQSVPVTVATDNQTTSIASAAAIGAGACEYAYLSYDQLGMQAGQTYPVTVTIDPARTVIANTNNQTVYSVTVPAAVTPTTTATSTPAVTDQSADVSAQSGNLLTMIVNWFLGLFGRK